jgi:hypothetical protein
MFFFFDFPFKGSQSQILGPRVQRCHIGTAVFKHFSTFSIHLKTKNNHNAKLFVGFGSVTQSYGLHFDLYKTHQKKIMFFFLKHSFKQS